MYGQMPYPYGNPAMQSAQQRLQMMEAQYPQFAANYGQPVHGCEWLWLLRLR